MNTPCVLRTAAKVLFFNRRPVYVSVKTEEAMLRFRDIPYGKVTETEESVRAYAEFVTGNGSVLRVEDRYSDENVSGMQRKGWAES